MNILQEALERREVYKTDHQSKARRKLEGVAMYYVAKLNNEEALNIIRKIYDKVCKVCRFFNFLVFYVM